MARGSVYKRHGRWAYKIDTGFNAETGNRRQATKQGFPTKKAAENALAEAQKTVIDGTVVANSSMTLTAYLDDWLAGQRSRWRRSDHLVDVRRWSNRGLRASGRSRPRRSREYVSCWQSRCWQKKHFGRLKHAVVVHASRGTGNCRRHAGRKLSGAEIALAANRIF